MNQKQLIEITCKCFGLYFIVEIFLNLKQLFFYGVASVNWGSDNFTLYFNLGQNLIDSIIYGIGAWILISKCESISSRLSNDKQGEIHLTASKADIIEIAIIAIGMLTIISAIPEILNKLTTYLYFNE